MRSLLDDQDLVTADAAVEHALRTGSSRGLPIVGHGEISTVLAWPPERPRAVVKRLPVFPNRNGLDAYRRLLADYTSTLADRGVDVVETELRAVPADAPRPFLVQPLVPADQLLSVGLADPAATDDWAGAMLVQLVDIVLACVDDRVGIDAQVSNWARSSSGSPLYLDVSTPFLRDRGWEDRLDLTWLCSVYAAASRPVIRRAIAPGVVAAYHDPRRVLVDLGANLHREGLTQHVGRLVDAAARRGVRLDPRDMRRFFVANTRTWRALRAMRRADAAWQRRVRRRPYPFLLPEDQR